MSQAAHNVDPNEVRKFEDLAHRWWDPAGEFRPLHEINPLRLEFVEQRAALDGKRVLDVGCGGGILSEAMAARGARVTGIDMAEGPLSVARLHRLESGLEVDYRQTNAEALAEELGGQFDVVTCMELLEHVPDPGSVVEACARLVKPGGDVFFSTINRNPKAFMLAIVGAEYLLRLLPRGTHEYQRFITPAELDRWCRAAGLEVAATSGLAYNPLNRRFRLTGDVDVNYLLHARPD
jgi:2-polyprenyl-6-hydroxyphenyl methylase/3-demethylubiquinone-9 3-methyltransferase